MRLQALACQYARQDITRMQGQKPVFLVTAAAPNVETKPKSALPVFQLQQTLNTFSPLTILV